MARPHAVGPCVNVVPLVLSGSDLPEIQTEADALTHPQQAMLTALARFERRRGAPLRGREQAEVARIFAAFASSANPLLRHTYASVIQAAADRATRAILDRLWEAKEMEIEELIRNEGEAEGRARGKAEMLLRLLARRGFDLDSSAQARVLHASAAELDAWFDRAIDAGQLADVFER